MENLGDSFGWLSVLGDRDTEQNEHLRNAKVSETGLNYLNAKRDNDLHEEDLLLNSLPQCPSTGLGFLEVFLNDTNLDQERVTINEGENRAEGMPNWPEYVAKSETDPTIGSVSGVSSFLRPDQNSWRANQCSTISNTESNFEDNYGNVMHVALSTETELSFGEPLVTDVLNCTGKISVPLVGSETSDFDSTTFWPSTESNILSGTVKLTTEISAKVLDSDFMIISPATETSNLAGTVLLPADISTKEEIEQSSAGQLAHCAADMISTHKPSIAGLELYDDALSSLLSVKVTSLRLLISGFFMWGRLIVRIMDHPFVTSVSGCTSETMLFLADRTQDLSDRYIAAITADDPETRHVQRLLQAREAVWGWVHQQSCFLSSLPFYQRQLLRETRDLDRNIEIAMAASTSKGSTALEGGVEGHSKGDEQLNVTNDNLSTISEQEHKNMQRKGGVSELHSILLCAAGEGDEEAQYALSRWFTPPTFQEGSICHDCSRPFSTSLFRHHCRCCGLSHCTLHSSQRRSLLRLGLGLISPVRVCDKCASNVDDEIHADNLTWRRLRVEAYLSDFFNRRSYRALNEVNRNISCRGDNSSSYCESKEELTRTVAAAVAVAAKDTECLIPYNGKYVDRSVDKIIRVADYSLQVVKSTVSLNYPTKLALHTVDILKRYGLSGLAGVLLRKDFMEAVETLKRISGIDHMFSLSLHELTACIYYKLAIDRGLRGCDPDGEFRSHQIPHTDPQAEPDFKLDTENSSKTESCFSENSRIPAINSKTSNTCWSIEVDEKELDDAIRFAPLAVNIVYEESLEDMQRLALTQGWSTILISSNSAPEQPAYALFASGGDTDRKDIKIGIDVRERKEVVLVVRGTASVQDIVTDIRAAPQRFPCSIDDIARALAPTAVQSPCDNRTNITEQMKNKRSYKDTKDELLDRDGWLLVNKSTDLQEEEDGEEESYACGGMARAAFWLLGEVGPALLQLHNEGFDIILAGHSMGGSVAALLCHLMRTHLATRIDHTNKATFWANKFFPTASPPPPVCLPTFRCVTYGCPSSMCARLAEKMNGYVTSVVLHDDIISRITPQSIRLLMRELLVFRQQVFRHLRQDWTDVITRARDLWSPRNRAGDDLHRPSYVDSSVEPSSKSQYRKSKDGNMKSSGCPSNADNIGDLHNGEVEKEEMDEEVEEEGPVLVEDEERGEWIPSLWLPGRILHIYSHTGRYKIAEVSRDLPTLRKIEVQGSIFTDHVGQTIFDALLEVRSVRASERYHSKSSCSLRSKTDGKGSPIWTAYDNSIVCECCECPFTWHSTFRGEAQEYRERYNCRQCGGLVCGPCSLERRAIPHLGLIQPSRVCDRCFHKGDYSCM